MEIDPTMAITAGIIFLFAGIFLAYIQNPINKAKMYRRLSKKNYGVIGILTKGKSIVLFMQNLSEPIYKFREMVLDPQKQNPYAVYSISEVPVMFYYDIDANPIVLETTVDDRRFYEAIKYEKDAEGNKIARMPEKAIPILLDPSLKIKVETISTDPNALYAAFQAYSELLRKQLAFKLKMFEMLLYGIIVISAIGAYLAWDHGPKLTQILEQIAALKADVAANAVKTAIKTV